MPSCGHSLVPDKNNKKIGAQYVHIDPDIYHKKAGISHALKARILISYILVILICTGIISFFTYKLVIQKVQSQAVESNTQLLDQLKNTVDNYMLDSVNKISLSLLNDDSNSQNIQYLFNNPVRNNMDVAWKAYWSLRYIKEINPIVDSISIYYKNNSLIVSSEGTKLLNLPSHSDWIDTAWVSLIKYGGQSDIWLDTRKVRDPSMPVDSSGKEIPKNVITLVRTYPASSTNDDMLGAIAVSVNEKTFCETVKSKSGDNIGQVFCVNQEGVVLSHNQKESLYTNISKYGFGARIIQSKSRSGYFICDVNGVKSVVSYSTSQYNNWRYVAVKPLSQVKTGLQFLSRAAVSIVITTLLIGLILALISTSKIYSPIKRLVDKSSNVIICEDTSIQPKNEYDVINLTLNMLVLKLKDQKQKLEDNMPVIRHHFLLDLVNSRFTKREEVCEKAGELGLDLSFSHFAVTIIRLRDISANMEQSASLPLKNDITGTIENFLDENNIKHICSAEDNNIICILNLEFKDAGLIFKLENLHKSLNECTRFIIQMGVGSICDDIMLIGSSYNDACKCIKYSYFYPEYGIFTLSEVSQWENNDDTKKMRSLLKSFYDALRLQDKESALTGMHSLFTAMRDEHCSYSSSMKVLAHLVNLMETMLAELNIDPSVLAEDNISSKHYNTGSIYEFEHWLSTFVNKLFMYLNSKRCDKNKDLIERIKRYIDENISSKSITLETVSAAMYLTPNYLSRIFKRETGTNFIDYVMDRKLDLSKSMLLSGSMKIEDIAYTIGYSSSQYFIKRFKLKYGITPRQYMRNHS